MLARTIVKQPNGKYAVWSTITDSFILINMSKKKLEKFFVAEAIKQASRDFKDDIKKIDKGYPISHYAEVFKDIHGEEEYQELIKDITSE